MPVAGRQRPRKSLTGAAVRKITAPGPFEHARRRPGRGNSPHPTSMSGAPMGHPVVMAFTLPIGIRVAAGLVGTAIDRLGTLPQELPAIGLSVAGQAFRTSMRIQQELAELAVRGDELLSGLTGRPEEHPAWATFDDDSDDARPTDADPTDADATDADPTDAGTRGAHAGGARARGARASDAAEHATEGATIYAVDTDWTVTNPIGVDAAAGGDGPPSDASATTSAEPKTTGRKAGERRRAAIRPEGPPRPRRTTPRPPPVANRQADANRRADRQPDTGADHGLTIPDLKDKLQDLDLAAVRELLRQEESSRGRAAYLTLLTNRVTTMEHANLSPDQR